jgi:hypothetical protein
VQLDEKAQPSTQLMNAQKAREMVEYLFPDETWIPEAEGVFRAYSRTPKSDDQRHVLDKEITQARILAGLGSVIYLLPEVEFGKKHPDAVVDGVIMEFKTITGSIRQVGERFNDARKKANHVFFKIDSALSKHSVARKLAGIISKRGYQGGKIIAYFSATGEICYWNIDDLT